MKKHPPTPPPLLTRIPSSESLSGDIKLQHHVQKIVATAVSPKKNLTTKQVVDILLTKHREYKRKNSASLISNVQAILSQIASTPDSILPNSLSDSSARKQNKRKSPIVPIGGSSSNTASNKHISTIKKEAQTIGEKRKHQSIDDENSEDEYEKEAKKHDSIRESLDQVRGGSMLNSGLRDRYKDIQRERDIAARKKAKEEAEEKENEDETTDVAVGDPSAKQSTSTPSGKKKKKKKVSRSNTAASGGNLSMADGSQSSLAVPTQRPKERYHDLGGLSSTLKQIRQLIEYPLAHPELFSHLGISAPRGVLFRGPPGCGKTHLANAIAGQLNVTYFRISAPEIVSSMSGESESRLRDLFQAASSSAPSIIFMDEIDAIAPKRGNDSGSSGKGMEKRIVAQLLTCMDSLSPENNKNGNPVLVLGATNRPDSIDSALRRAGRFDREICLGVPDEEGRESILRVMTKDMRLDTDLDFKLLAKKTPGFVGADLRSLTKEAGVIAINRIFKDLLVEDAVSTGDGKSKNHDESDRIDESNSIDEAAGDMKAKGEVETSTPEGMDRGNAKSTHCITQDINSVIPFTEIDMEPLYVTMTDFLLAVPHVQPSSKREGFATVPDVSWDDVGALKCIREELTLSVLEPIQSPEKFQALGLPLPAGVLLYGPPGCGKTLLAKAIANESGANFISVKGPELLDKYVGESERAVRVVFERARSSSPCIVFFDELDSLCPKRGSDSGGGGVSERVVNQLLTEMDGLDSRRSVFVIAATNRPELIDPAMLRPGRLDKLLYVPLPQPQDRADILKALAKNIKLSANVDIDAIGKDPRAEGYSGADCAALLREAGLSVLRNEAATKSKQDETIGKDDLSQSRNQMLQIQAKNFDYAFDHVMPSVSKRDQARYDKMRDRMARARTRGDISDQKEES